MKETKLTNMPQMDVNSLVEKLSYLYSSVINKGGELKNTPAVMLWGPPGVGKSQAIRQIAKEIESATGKRTKVTDVRLLLFNPIDLRGIPTANADKTLAIWLRPQIFDMEEGEDTVNFLFLDEITAAPQSVQAAAYQITLDRVVGEHRLPDNCIVIAAGNRTTDKSVSYKMPKALANRLMHIEVESNLDSWTAWAVNRGINKKVLGFLSYMPNYLMQFDTSKEELAFATPRTWEMVSNILNTVSDDIEVVFPMIAGLVGSGVAIEFLTWSKVYMKLPSMKDIFSGRCSTVPKGMDELYALVSAMTVCAKEHKDNFNAIAYSIEYATKLPADFAVVLMRNYINIEKGYRNALMRMPVFANWITTMGKHLNGIV